MSATTPTSGAADRCQACVDRNDGFYGSYAPKCPAHNDDGTPRDTALAKAQQPALTAQAISAEPAIPALQPVAPIRDLEAVIKAAADKLDAAVRCHPNAVDTLINEALEILDGDREAPVLTHGAAIAALPSECDSPEICSISKSCAGQFGSKRICASHGQAPAQPVDFTTLGAAMRAIQQAIGLIGDPADERMQAVRRVLRGAVVVAEDSGDIPAQPDCLTCNDHGAVGNILTAEPCPDCTPTPQAADTGAAWGAGITRIPLPDGAELSSESYTIGSPRTFWRLRKGGSHIRWLNNFEREFVNAALTAAPQPAPPADSVLEDASRYEMVRRGQHWSVVDGIGNCLRAEGLDAAVDTVRKQRGAT